MQRGIPSPSTEYWALPKAGPYETRLGSAIITMVEPEPGHEQEYNRWYEDDHFYAGATAMPWVFAGRRWVAPRRLQLLRAAGKTPLFTPIGLGAYISVYWIVTGRELDVSHWAVSTLQRLVTDGRMFAHRTHLFTGFHRHLGTVYRDASGPRDIHALDTSVGGLVFEVLMVPSPQQREAAWLWLRDEHIPRKLEASPVSMCVGFEALVPPTDLPPPYDQSGTPADCVTLLWFVDDDPERVWTMTFADECDRVLASGVADVGLLAPFLPTVPGTDRYVDELRVVR